VSSWRSDHAKTSTAAPIEASWTAAPARGRQQRRHEVRAAAVVLLRRVAGVAGALLVGADGLVLDAVIGGQLAAAQGDERGRERERRERGLAAEPARAPAQHHSGGRRRAHRDRDGGVLEGQLGLRQCPLDQRDDGHRLAQAHDPAHAGDPAQAAAHARLGPGGDRDAAVVGADGRGPVIGAVHEQPVAQGHPAQAQLVVLLLTHRAAPW
jgi:hypothetical protein